MDSVRTYLSAGHYEEALHILSTIQNRNAEWYYYSALGNYGLGNKVTALEHAQKAVQLDPGNVTYQDLVNNLQNPNGAYRRHNAHYGMPFNNVSSFCISAIILNFICGIFGASGIGCLPCYCFWC